MSGLIVFVLCVFFALYVIFSDSENSQGGESFNEKELKQLLE